MKPVLENVLKLICKHLDVKISLLIRTADEFSDVVGIAALNESDYSTAQKITEANRFPKGVDSETLLQTECCELLKKEINAGKTVKVDVYGNANISYFLILFLAGDREISLPDELLAVLQNLLEFGEKPVNIGLADYTVLTKSFPFPVALIEPEGEIVSANKFFESKFEPWQKGEKKITELELTNAEGAVLKLKEVLKESNPENSAFTFDRDEKFFKVIPVKVSEAGKDNLFLILFVPVTDLALNLFNYRKALENIDIVVYSMKADGSGFDFISKTAKKLFGYEIEKLTSSKFSLLRIIGKTEFPKVRKFLEDVRKGEHAVVEYGITDAEGRQRFIRHSGIPIQKEGRTEKVVGAIVDVTKEVELRESLRYAEEKFKMLMDTTEDLIFSLDKYGNFLLINKNGSRTLGYTENEMLGKHFLEFVDEDNKADVAVAFQNILSSDEVVRFEAKLLDAMEEEVIFEIQAKSVRENGELSGIMAIGRDITQRIKHEKELQDLNSKLKEANRIISIERDRAKEKISLLEELNRMKNEFISNVSHELRTPLASIVGFAEAVVQDSEMPRETITEFNNIIYSEGKRLAKLINDLLDFSKLESEGEKLEREDFDLIPLLREILTTYVQQAEEKGITFSSSVPEAEIILNGDKERIKNAIGHIVSNAVKFTPKGGRISLLLNNFLNEVEIIISDTGVGIPKDELPKLFQKFSKINRPGDQTPGAGIGLAMAKKIVDLHNGLINVKSKLNEGTTFIIRLPKKV